MFLSIYLFCVFQTRNLQICWEWISNFPFQMLARCSLASGANKSSGAKDFSTSDSNSHQSYWLQSTSRQKPGNSFWKYQTNIFLLDITERHKSHLGLATLWAEQGPCKPISHSSEIGSQGSCSQLIAYEREKLAHKALAHNSERARERDWLTRFLLTA